MNDMNTRAESLRYFPRALLRKRRKPFLMWIGPPLLAVQALATSGFVLMIIAESEGSVAIADRPLELILFKWLVAPVILAVCGLHVAGAYGLLADRSWVRRVLTRWMLVLVAASLPLWVIAGVDLRGLLLIVWRGGFWVAFLFWYFYRYPPVVEYYRKLERAQR